MGPPVLRLGRPHKGHPKAISRKAYQGLRKGDEPMFPMKKPIRLLGMVFQID